ncbi:MAG: hypothetical protein JXA69_05345 [Phycisphaerae bacterium]|nr:hypothetical protein [Phycisphaerae bacterium]
MNGLTPAGWVLMLASCGFVLVLVTFCFYRVLRSPKAAEHMHAPLDIDTHDKGS